MKDIQLCECALQNYEIYQESVYEIGGTKET